MVGIGSSTVLISEITLDFGNVILGILLKIIRFYVLTIIDVNRDCKLIYGWKHHHMLGGVQKSANFGGVKLH